MFGRRTTGTGPLTDQPVADSPEPDFNLDALGDLPDVLADALPIVPEHTPTPSESAVARNAFREPARTQSSAVTRTLPRPELADLGVAEEAVPRTDMENTQYARLFVAPPTGQNAMLRAQATTTTAPANTPIVPASRGIAESVIGPDDFFDGHYRSERGVRIQGNARGSIESRQYIFVEAGAIVEADLSAEDITISGDFKGKITCRRRLEVTSAGVIQGQVQTSLLVVQEGGRVDGEVRMGASQVPPAEGDT